MLDLIKELDKLSLTLDFLTRNEARQIVDVVNERIRENLNAHIIDVLWKQEGRFNDILQPFTSLNHSRRSDLKPFEVGTKAAGIWPWIYRHRQPVWVERIRYHDLNEPIQNIATMDEIEAGSLDFFKDTDSIMAIPLFFRDSLWGIYSVELPMSGKLDQETLELLTRLAGPIANLIWKSDAYELNDQQTTKAIERFKDALQQTKLHLNPYRTGFIARPFCTECAGYLELEECLIKFLTDHQIQAKRYIHPPGNDYVVSEIMNQIKDAHFGIVDVTGFNPNVMLELGMMMILGKKFLLFRRKDDQASLPFDIRNYQCYQYEIRTGGINTWNPGDNESIPLEDVLTSFIPQLYQDPDFIEAKPFIEAEAGVTVC
jgi:hypothetical protein